MESWLSVCGLLAAVISMVLDVAQFWKKVTVPIVTGRSETNLSGLSLQRLLSWWKSKSPRNKLLHGLATARSYEEWEETAFELDELLSTDLW